MLFVKVEKANVTGAISVLLHMRCPRHCYFYSMFYSYRAAPCAHRSVLTEGRVYFYIIKCYCVLVLLCTVRKMYV